MKTASESVRPSTARARLFIKLMAAFLVVVLTVGALVVWSVGRSTRQQFHLFASSVNQRQAERIAPLLADYYGAVGSWEGVETVLTFGASASFRHDGMGMMGRPGGADGAPTPWGDVDMWRMMGTEVVIVDAAGRVAAGVSTDLIGAEVDKDSLAAGAPVWVNGEHVGTVLVAVGAFSENLNESFLQQVGRATLGAVLIAGLLALLLGGLITWGITKPLRRLTLAAEGIAGGDLTQRVDASAGDEVGDLARAFNRMAAELEHAESLRKQMTADIAHELRTPLSVIQGNVEALQDGVFPLTLEALEPIQDKTQLLARLVEDLRNLALAEAGRLPLDRQPTDLAALVQRTAAGFQASADAKSIALELDGDPNLPMVDADPQRVEQVLVNLLSNALRHTPAEGCVSLKLKAPGGARQVTVQISDTGAGIPIESLSNVFERFYRIDPGRARGKEEGGSGLGLAVARSIIEAHGGSIGVESPPGQGAAFWFTLPAIAR